jgi:hypothetical protein
MCLAVLAPALLSWNGGGWILPWVGGHYLDIVCPVQWGILMAWRGSGGWISFWIYMEFLFWRSSVVCQNWRAVVTDDSGPVY